MEGRGELVDRVEVWDRWNTLRGYYEGDIGVSACCHIFCFIALEYVGLHDRISACVWRESVSVLCLI